MRKQRKFLALLMTLILAISTIPTMAMADEEPVYTYEEGLVYKQVGEGEKTPLTEDELADFSGVSLHGIAAFNEKIFPTMQAAYDAISAELEKEGNGGLDASNGYPTDEAFEALYTDPYDGEGHQGVSLTWTIFGTVELGSGLPDYYVSGGRAAAWYGSDAKTIRRITMVGYDENAQLNIQKNPTMPYQWWGDTTDGYMEFVIQDLTLVKENEYISVSGNYRDEFALTLDHCTIRGGLTHYFNGKGSLTADNCTFDGEGQKNVAYAFWVVTSETTEPMTVQFTNNKVSGYPRGINIHQNTAVVTISNNEIESNHLTRGTIQLTACGEVSITDNTIKNQSGSAFWFYPGYSCEDTTITGNAIESAYLFQVGDEEDQTLNEEVKAGLTFTDNDISGVADPYNSPVKDGEGTDFKHNILEGLQEDSENTFVSKVSLDRTTLTLTEGESTQLTATVQPEHAPDKSVTWSSSNPAVAVVDGDGRVTAVSKGTATITVVTTDGGKKAVCAVTVSPSAPPTPSAPSTPSTSSRDDDDDGYAVSVPSSSSIKHGSITVSPRTAEKGDTVTITVKPDPGYELDELTVTAGGADVKLTQKSDTKYTFTMPASRVSVAVSFVKTGAADTRVFTDVPGGHWAEDEIAWAAENGYMNGNTATTFNPDGTVTRQQLWMILARLSGLRPAGFVEAKDWAVQSGVTDGTNPGSAVSRQQLVTILYRWAKLMGRGVSGSADLTAYPDYASVASYAVDAMGWSVANGIVTGTAQGTLNPAGTATRAQFAVILYRFCEKTAG